MNKWMRKLKYFSRFIQKKNTVQDAGGDPVEQTTTSLKGIVIIVTCGTFILFIVGMYIKPSISVKQESSKKELISKDWLPPHQFRTEGAVLEKALKELKGQGVAIQQLERRWREEMLTSEVRWQKIEETLSELQKSQRTIPPNKMDAGSSGHPGSDEIPSLPLRYDTLALQSPEQPPLKKTEANYVPAGSFVKAVLLSGLDVSAGVTAGAEPRPVLMRVTDEGSLPNNLKSQLTGCRLIGAAVGDVSSERAYIRLERLSCVHQEEFTDFPVYGYVSGTDGKAGIRGRVVMKDAAVVSRAFLSGFLGGLSDSAANGLTESSVSPLGQVNSIGANDVLKYGGYEGASSAMDLYADYLIKRAEQYQPVIEVSAGTPVDVVFHKGFYLEGLRENDASPIKASKTVPSFYTQNHATEEEN